jgi:hypothetical protein
LVGRLRHPDVHDRGQDLAHAVRELDGAQQVVGDIAEVGDEWRRDQVRVIGESIDQLAHRDRVTPELHRVVTETEDLELERGTWLAGRRVRSEDLVLELVCAILQLLDHFEVVVDDLIGDGVERRGRAGSEGAHDRPPRLRLRQVEGR